MKHQFGKLQFSLRGPIFLSSAFVQHLRSKGLDPFDESQHVHIDIDINGPSVLIESDDVKRWLDAPPGSSDGRAAASDIAKKLFTPPSLGFVTVRRVDPEPDDDDEQDDDEQVGQDA